jgi:hypothetical protein
MTRHFPIRLAVVLTALAVPLLALAQPAGPKQVRDAGAKGTAKAVSAPSKPAAPASRSVSKPAPGGVAASARETYSYRAEGRRDPFVSLLNRGSDPRTQRKAEGLAGVLVGDAVLKGILQSRGMFLAIVQGSDGKRPYIVHPNDRFADGVVKAITADSMLILQEVNDPLSLTKQREIRKTLRAVEEVK